MNRRAFLVSGGSTTALLATGGLGTSRKAVAQSSATFDPTVLEGSAATHAAMIASSFNGMGQPSDLFQLANAQQVAVDTLSGTDFDDRIKALAATTDPNSLNLDNVDYSAIVSGIQMYAPDFTAADLQTAFSWLPVSPAAIGPALSDLAQNGLLHHVQSMVPQYRALGAALLRQSRRGDGDPGPEAHVRYPFAHHNGTDVRYNPQRELSRVRSATYYPDRDKPHLERASWQRAMMYLDSGGGGGTGYSCGADAMAAGATTIAVAVVSTMCFLSVIGTPICLPVVMYWVGMGGAAWVVGHGMKCNAF